MQLQSFCCWNLCSGVLNRISATYTLPVLLWVNALQWCTQWDNWHNFYVHSYSGGVLNRISTSYTLIGKSAVEVYSAGSLQLIYIHFYSGESPMVVYPTGLMQIIMQLHSCCGKSALVVYSTGSLHFIIILQ